MSGEYVPHHALGDHEAALQLQLHELEGMHRGDPRLPGMLGVIALSYERSSNRITDERQRIECQDRALSFARRAYLEEADAPYGVEADEHAAIRAEQRPSVALNAGIVFLRAAARARLANPLGEETEHEQELQGLANQALDEAWTKIQEKARRGDPRPHQHAINAAGRMAIRWALGGDHWSALGMSGIALVYSAASESRWLASHTTSGLSWHERYAARREGMGQSRAAAAAGAAGDRLRLKAKAAARAVGAAGVAALSLPPWRGKQPAIDRRDKLILRFV